MKKRHHNPNGAKIHRIYTVEEAVNLYDVFKGTVRNWVKAGLPVLNDKRPMLILGSALVECHRAKNANGKQICKPGKMYCVKCHATKTPDGNKHQYDNGEICWYLSTVKKMLLSINNITGEKNSKTRDNLVFWQEFLFLAMTKLISTQ